MSEDLHLVDGVAVRCPASRAPHEDVAARSGEAGPVVRAAVEAGVSRAVVISTTAVYGVPETFFIDRRGIVRYKSTGPVPWNALNIQVQELLRSRA